MIAAISAGLTASTASAGQDPDVALPAAYEGPAAPVFPQTIARDAEGRMTIRAARLTAALRVDGELDESIYETLQPISDFIQMEPNGGQPATERTDVWIFFDQSNVYVTLRAWESQPERMIVNEMRRDSNNIRMADCIGFSLDTFYDRRNAFQFEVNPLGARTDGQSTNERQYSADWNPVWDLAVGRFSGGWTVEAAIPFKSLRYRPGSSQVWGFNARRNNKWKNEISYLARIPPAFGIGRGSFAASLFATVVGIDAPSGAKNLEIKPYLTSDLNTDLNAAPQVNNEVSGDFGVDAKYGITQNMTADLTYNTDFAQVEADEQQVNLTRFSLFFPEKREFFLENQGTFAFGGAAATGMGAGGDTPILFYSRRIGLNGAQAVPILAGGRLTGRAGRFSLGLINIATDQDRPAPQSNLVTNFGVVRVKRDIFRRSSIGALFTTRSVAQNGRGSNQAYGLDGTFAFFENLFVNTYWARTVSEGVEEKDTSFRAQLEYAGDRYGLQLERLDVGDNFTPDVGFVRRDDMRRHYVQGRFSPRPARIRSVRKFSWVGSLAYIEDGSGRLETRTADGEFAIEFANSDRFSVSTVDSYERVDASFPIGGGVRVPVGEYEFRTARVAYLLGQQRAFSGNIAAEVGTFYGGDITSVTFNRARINLTSRFSLEPSISVNHVELPQATVTTKLVGSRVTYTVTPLMFASALLQWNSSTSAVSANVRLRWEYHPGSELFVVYNEERDSQTVRFPGLENRTLILKINRLFRF